MALGSVLRTALTGISAAEMAVAVVANNLANTRTVGFKASRVEQSSRKPATLSSGRAPTAAHGGTNPAQIGTGVQAVTVTSDHAQGANALTAEPTELAVLGDVGRDLIDLVLASTQFRGSAAVFSTADQLLGELTNLRR